MCFKIIIVIILYISLIAVMYNAIVGIRKKDDKLTVLCGIASGLIGMLFGIVLSSILFV